jgi:SAM-dependent methyltransferase
VDRVVQHLDDPQKAIAELCRVLKRGGRLVIGEPDWESLAYEYLDELGKKVTGLLKSHLTSIIRNPAMGRQVARLYVESKLFSSAEMACLPVVCRTDAESFLYPMKDALEPILKKGILKRAEAERFLAQIKQIEDNNLFLVGMSFYISTGVKKLS